MTEKRLLLLVATVWFVVGAGWCARWQPHCNPHVIATCEP